MATKVGINGFGRVGRKVDHTEDSLLVDDRPIAVLSYRDPAAIDWGAPWQFPSAAATTRTHPSGSGSTSAVP
jgi:glyceraldehyde-3-phosphate dehydrogenase/erythrose-4-phosphate dehydrogenase